MVFQNKLYIFIFSLLFVTKLYSQNEYYPSTDNSNSATISGKIVVNELMSCNTDEYMDPSMNYGGWVELYNPNDYDIDLSGLYVSDDSENLCKHKLSEGYGSIPSHGFGILNFGHHEVWTALSYRQIDFKLNPDGGMIILSDGREVICEMHYPSVPSRISYCRKIDGGGEWAFSGRPSPGESNTLSGVYGKEQISSPSVDTDSRVFSGVLKISVDIPDGGHLIYTTDGSSPSESNGRISEDGKFEIDTTTCFRFRLYHPGYLPSSVVTRSYIEDKNYPFPIISIVTSIGNFYDPDYGLFMKGQYGRGGNGSSELCNWNMDWDRPVNFEYITAFNSCEINQECDLSMCGGWSRSSSPHSIKLKAEKSYDGKNRFPYMFFEEKPYLSYKTLQIRNGGNDSECRIKDAILQQVVSRSGIDMDYQSWQPVHVFINGNHYAVLNMREANNKDYVYSNYGYGSDEIDQFEINPDSCYVQKRGTKTAFDALLMLSGNASEPSVYTQIKSLLDIDEYINYMAIELFLANRDWPYNNVKGFRKHDDGRFRFVLFDLDLSYSTFTPFKDFFANEWSWYDPLYGYDYSRGISIEGTRLYKQNEFVTLFKNLLSNKEFRKRFIDTYSIIGGSIFQYDRVHSISNEMSSYLNQGGYVDSSPTANYIGKFFIDKYQSDMHREMRECPVMGFSDEVPIHLTLSSDISCSTLSMNEIELPYSSFNGYVYWPIRLKAYIPEGYDFIGWSDDSGQILSSDTIYTIGAELNSISLTAHYVKSTHAAYSSRCSLVINELSASNSIYVNEYHQKRDWIEIYNCSDTNIDLNGWYLSDHSEDPYRYQISNLDSGISTIVPSHGFKVIWCDKEEEESQLHVPFKLASEGGIVMLTSPDQSYTNSLNYTLHNGDMSVGRYPNGSDKVYLMARPSICKSNIHSSYLIEMEQDEYSSITDAQLTSNGSMRMNYFDGQLHIYNDESNLIELTIYDITGSMVLKSNLYLVEGHTSFAISPLSSGIYIVHLKDGEGNSCSLKFYY